MKLLLTDSGITNGSIQNALIELLGKPIAECDALFIPTAQYAHPGGALQAYLAISDSGDEPSMTGLGWKSVGILELSALQSVGEELWVPMVKAADVLLVEGGDPMFLAYWMRESGLAYLFPSLTDMVYVGLSAGSMVMTPSIGKPFVRWSPPEGGDTTLGIVDFSISPHVDHPDLPSNTMANAEKWATMIPRAAYVIDHETAIKVVDGVVEVISEGNWRLLNV